MSSSAFSLFFCLAFSACAADFPIPYNTEKETIPFLKPAEALALVKMPEGFHATIFASEPEITQPIHITTDARGRLWVCENNTYAERARNFDTNLHDRIIILEDTDHDGRADKRTVFWDEGIELTSAFPGFGGVFALCPPRLLFIPDRDGNDVPDGEPQVLLDGFDASAVRHNIANGLKLGPDGWLYGRHGILATSHVGAPGTPAAERANFNAAIWRFHPVTHKFEVVCEGTTNPWGHDWDENGQLFFINTVIGHLWHAIPGAYYKRMYGEHANPYLYELIDQTADHVHWDTAEKWSDIRDLGVTATTSERGGGHAHSGFMIYQGDNWPAQYRNTALTINYHGKRLNNDRIVRAGATYTATHLPDPIQFGDPWFRGIELITGPDGGVYVADWSDIGECHDDSGIHRTSGRIYKIVYGTPKLWIGDLRRTRDDDLLTNLLSKNQWLATHSRQVLQEKDRLRFGTKNVIPSETQRLFRETGNLNALWLNYVVGGLSIDKGFGKELLSHENENVRTWAIQLLVDQQAPSPEIARAFADLSKTEKSGLVLTFLASAMRKATAKQKIEIAQGLVTHREFAGDLVFPLMVWYAIQPEIPDNIPAAVALAEKSKIPKIRRFVTRRIFEDLAKNPDAAEQITALLTTNRTVSFQSDMLTGMYEALKGVKSAKAPANWNRLTIDPSNGSLHQILSAIFGDTKAIESLRTFALTKPQALETLIQICAENLAPILTAALDKPNLAPLALRSFATIGDPETPKILLARYNSLASTNKTEAINTLASRTNFALPFLEAIQRGQIRRQDVTATHLRQLRSLSDPAVTQKIFAIWPQLDNSPTGKKSQFAKYKSLLTPERLKAASPAAGRATFQQVCATCHVLFGEGARIGPELTGSDRRNLDYLLDNVVDPSGVVPESYRVSNITLKDGRSLTGIVLNQTDRTLTVQTPSEKIVVQKADVQEQQDSKLSMMPDGLLEALTEEQAVDLVSYLISDPK